jgi:hypothetical protein
MSNLALHSNMVSGRFLPNPSPLRFQGDPSPYFRPGQSISEKDFAETVAAGFGSESATDLHKTITIQGRANKSVTHREMQSSTFEKRVFDSLVSLKVLVSQYAMHLDSSERHKIFYDLDDIINIDDWHEEDKFPDLRSFRAFLRWAVYASFREWTSLGVSDDGNILLAWQTKRGLLTANFGASGQIRWTAKINSPTGVEYAAGQSTPQYFASQARFYLEG